MKEFKISDEDMEQTTIDSYVYGSCFMVCREDGTAKRVSPLEVFKSETWFEKLKHWWKR